MHINAVNSVDAVSLLFASNWYCLLDLAPHVPVYEQILLCPIPTAKQHERKEGRHRPSRNLTLRIFEICKSLRSANFAEPSEPHVLLQPPRLLRLLGFREWNRNSTLTSYKGTSTNCPNAHAIACEMADSAQKDAVAVQLWYADQPCERKQPTSQSRFRSVLRQQCKAITVLSKNSLLISSPIL